MIELGVFVATQLSLAFLPDKINVILRERNILEIPTIIKYINSKDVHIEVQRFSDKEVCIENVVRDINKCLDIMCDTGFTFQDTLFFRKNFSNYEIMVHKKIAHIAEESVELTIDSTWNIPQTSARVIECKLTNT